MATATLSIDLEARLAKLEQGMSKATSVVVTNSAKMEASLNGLKNRTDGIFKGIALGLASVISVETFKGAIMSTSNYADELGKMSQRVGVAVEDLSGLAYAGNLADVSNEALGTGLKKMSKLLAEGSDKFQLLGVKTKETSGAMRPTIEIFADVADKFAGLENGSIKTALAMALFGKSGADLIPLLNAGGKGIRDAADEARKFGLIVSAEAAKAAEEFNDNLTRMAALSKGATMELANGLIPAMSRFLDNYIELKKAGALGTVLKDAAKDVFGLGQLTANPGADISRFLDDRAKIQDRLAKGGVPKGVAAAWRTEIDELNALLEVARIKQRRLVLENPVDAGDAFSRRFKPAATKVDKRIFADDKKAESGAKEFAALQGDIAARISANNAEIESGQKLSASQQYLLAVVTKLASAESNLDAKQKATLTTELERFALGAQTVELLAQEEAARTKANAANDKHLTQLATDNEAIVKGNATLALEIEAMGLDTKALGRLTLARLDANLAREQEALLNARNIEGNEAEILQIERRIRLLEIERGLAGKKLDKEKDVITAEDNKKRSEALTQSINDGILNGFREGHTLAEIFLGELKAQFAATVLTPVIKPIAETGGKIISTALAAMFGFADGGVMSSAGPVPLRKYLGGGVASSPQVAIFGEGSMKEAFVPLPDGRNIPVVMRGGGGGRPIVINISAVVGDIASKADVVAGMQATARQIQASIGRSMQYGGAMS